MSAIHDSSLFPGKGGHDTEDLHIYKITTRQYNRRQTKNLKEVDY